LQELRASLDAVEDPRPEGAPERGQHPLGALQQLSEWKGLLAQNVPIARQILREVLEGRLVFVPRHEADEHWNQFTRVGSSTKFLSAVAPLNAVASPQGPGRLYTLRSASVRRAA
jgi:hypothetical protein